MICNHRAGDLSRKKMGGKAYNLARLSAIPSIRVPRWICLTTDFFYEYLGERRSEYEALLEHYTPRDREKVLALLESCEFTGEQKGLLRSWINQEITGAKRFAVRSSAVDEDSAEHSFAGMMESYLNVETGEEILSAIRRCYLSCFSERIMEYRQNNGLVGSDIAVAVVVQEMVDPDHAGVLFTVNPNTNNPDEMLVSVVQGLGEQLVSGEADSIDTVVDVLDEFVKKGEGGLSDDVMLSLVHQARTIADSYDPKRGLDMEFAVKNGRIWFLQCRAIAAYQGIDLNKPRTILDNSNIIESYSGVTTPLTFTFAREVYGKIYHQTARNFLVPEEVIREVSDNLNHMLVFFENKVYYHLNNWYLMTSLYPGYEKNKRYMENMMGVKTPLKETAEESDERKQKIHRQFLYKMARMKMDSDAFLRRFHKVTAPYANNRFDGWKSEDLLGVYRELEEKILDEFTIPIGNDMGSMVVYGKLTDSLKQHGVPDYEGVISCLLSRQGNVESARQTTDLLNIVADIRKDEALKQRFLNDDIDLSGDEPIVRRLNEYIEEFGARSMEELKLETVTLLEDPAFLFDTIRNYLALPPMEEKAPTRSDDEKTALILLDRYYNKSDRRKLNLLFRLTKFFIRNRERLRLRRTYIYDIVRNIYLGIGRNFAAEGRIDHYRDIFFLEKDEVTEMVYGSLTEDVRERIARRKEEYEENKNKETYERMYFYGDISRENMLPIYTQQEIAAEDGVLRGVAGGGNAVEGIVKYIEDPSDTFPQGSILMAKRTDPGWTVLFPMASAIIIERGSVLSHSAVIAREMGVTLVVGVRGLTDTVKDGDRVRVDGINGTIEILESDHGGSKV